MRIVNMSSSVEQVKLVSTDGKLDYITVMPKRQVAVPEGFNIDPNWAATHPLIKIIQTQTEA
jgi:hypothetical protein